MNPVLVFALQEVMSPVLVFALQQGETTSVASGGPQFTWPYVAVSFLTFLTGLTTIAYQIFQAREARLREDKKYEREQLQRERDAVDRERAREELRKEAANVAAEVQRAEQRATLQRKDMLNKLDTHAAISRDTNQKIVENTAISTKALEKADAAYSEANTVNQKIADMTKVYDLVARRGEIEKTTAEIKATGEDTNVRVKEIEHKIADAE